MSNIGGVKGEGAIPEPGDPKKKKKTDSDSFKEMMKVGKAREVDPEEKRKRKRREESQEEANAEITAGPPSQGLQKIETPPPAPFEPKIAGASAAPSAEGEEQTPPAAAQPPPPPPPPFFPRETAPTPSYPSTPEIQQQQPAQPTSPAAKKKRKKPVSPIEEPKPKIAKKTREAPPHVKPERKETRQPEKVPYKDEGKETFFRTLAHPEPQKVEEKKAEEPIEEVPSPLPPGAWEATKISPEEKKKAEKEEQIQPIETNLAGVQPSPLDISIPAPTTAPTATPFINLPPQILQIYERMVGVMTVMTAAGVTETTINLNAPQFEGSVFFGAQITITEFSTAPKAFNIEFIGSPQATNLFKGNVEELVAAFQAGNYNFKVHRIDTSVSPTMREEQRPGRVKRKQGKKGT